MKTPYFPFIVKLHTKQNMLVLSFLHSWLLAYTLYPYDLDARSIEDPVADHFGTAVDGWWVQCHACVCACAATF